MIALLTAASLGAQDQGGMFSIADAPSWVHAAAAAEPASGEGAGSQSVDHLLVDYQANVGTQERYTHIVMQVRTPQGVQDGSSVMVDFDPSYQKLILHSLRVVRRGVASSRLTRKAVQVLHREADLESFIIDGALTASVVVQDVRVGDVIDYAYTLRGMNPVFQGHYRDEFPCGWHVPVRREHIRVLFPQSRSIQWKVNGAAAEPSRTQRDGTIELEWSFTDMKPVPQEDRTPSWYIDTPWIDLSEFAGWEDVRSWALTLYPRAPVPPALDALVRQWNSDTAGAERKVRAALDYVQQNIRYLGVELGAGSYRPRAPGAVCETRFGDCKDQAYLLITLLRRMGFDAAPVLVNTALRSLVGDLLPSPTCFNHVIVAITLDGHQVFLDPTQTYQRGAVPQRFIPDYGYGLIVAEGGKGLYRFGAAQGTSPDVDVHEKFTVGGREEPALLEVETVARGAAADYLREVFASRRLEEIEKDYLNYYADRYPSIATTGHLSVADEPDGDVFTTMEHYTIPGFWGDADVKGAHAASFHPDVMGGELPTPRTKVRSTPMEVDYPRHVVQRITIDLPEPWTVKAEDTTVTTAAFSLRSKIDASAKTVSLFYEYRSRAAEVPARDMTKYNVDVLRIEDDLGYRLTWGAPGAESGTGSPDPLAPIVIGLSTLLFVAGALGLYRWAARSRRSARAGGAS